jgi:hypothetical protein
MPFYTLKKCQREEVGSIRGMGSIEAILQIVGRCIRRGGRLENAPQCVILIPGSINMLFYMAKKTLQT